MIRSLFNERFLHFGLVDRLASLRRHIVLIMFGQNGLSVKNSVCAHMALSNASPAFLEEIRQNPLINNRDAGSSVGNCKANGQSIRVALETVFLFQSTDSERSSSWGFLRSYLGRTKKEDQIVLESIEDKRGGEAETCKSHKDKCNSLMTLFHDCYFRAKRASPDRATAYG